MVEIFAKPPRAQRLRQIFVGGRDDPRVDGLRARGAQPAHDPLLEDLQELRLQRGRERADLVEEQHPAMRELKEPGLGLVRARERPALVPEKLGFKQVLGNRRAVEVDERGGRARPGAMHRACDKTFARPCLTAQEDGRGAAHGGGALQDVFELLPQQPDAGAVTQDFSEGDNGPAHERGPDVVGSFISSARAASARSSQNGMSISRYIAVAATRCSCASCRLPARACMVPRPRRQ